MEVTPAQVRKGITLGQLLPAGSRIYVPFLPAADFFDSVTACRNIIADDMRPVPHIAARAVRSEAELDDWLAALTESGVDSILLIAGDRSSVAGPYASTLDVLDSGRLLAHGIRRIGVAGHPDGHPVAIGAELDAALAAKLDYARASGTDMWIVTQFVFSSSAVISWLRHVRAIAGGIPVHIGVPGPARVKTLIKYAAQCGVSVTARMLRKRPSAIRLLGRWTPDGLVRDLVAHSIGEAQAAINDIHVYPFGGLAASAEWLAKLARPGSAYPGQADNAGDTSRGQRK